MHNRVKMFSRKTGEVYSLSDAFLNLDQEINSWIENYSVKVLNTSFTTGKMYYVPGTQYLHFDVMAFVTYEHINSTPPIPNSLSVSKLSGTSLTLEWSVSTPTVPIDFYMIYQDGELIGKSTTASFDVTGLQKGETYDFKVKSYDVVGNTSNYSATLTVTSEDITSPTAPSDLDVYAVNKTTVTLHWEASTDEDSGIKNYIVYKNGARCGSSATATFEALYLEPNTTYTFEVRAVDKFGNQSNLSNLVTVTTLA